MIACVIPPIRAPATRPANTVSSFLGRRYCCVMGRGGNKRASSWAKGKFYGPARSGAAAVAVLHNSPPMNEPLLDVRALTKRYGGAPVVDALSFQIAAGECLGVIGPNGAGKTTTIRMCLGLTEPDGGE